MGQMDPARIVLLPAGEGVVTFGSDGALFIAPYRRSRVRTRRSRLEDPCPGNGAPLCPLAGC